MTPPEGMNSVLILDDRDAKKRKFLAFFDTKDAIAAAEPAFEQQGEKIPEGIRGGRTSVHYYEVVIDDSEIEHARAARVSVLEGSPDAIDASLDKTRVETLPILSPGIIGVGMGAFTLSYDEYARTTLVIGERNTLPIEIYALISSATTPMLFAIGTVTTAVSFLIIGLTLWRIVQMQRRRSAVGTPP